MKTSIENSSAFGSAIVSPATFAEFSRRGKTNPLESDVQHDKEQTEGATVQLSISELQDNPMALVEAEQNLLDAVTAYFEALQQPVPAHLKEATIIGNENNIIARALEETIAQSGENSHVKLCFVTSKNGQLDIVSYFE